MIAALLLLGQTKPMLQLLYERRHNALAMRDEASAARRRAWNEPDDVRAKLYDNWRAADADVRSACSELNAYRAPTCKAAKRNKMEPFRYPTADPQPYAVGQRVRVQIVDLSLYGLGAESLQQLCGTITRHNVPGGACIEEQYLVRFDTPQPYPNRPDWEQVTHFWFPKCDLEPCAS